MGPLDHRQRSAQGFGQRRARGDGARLHGLPVMVRDRVVEGAHQRREMAVLTGPGRREAHIMAHRQQPLPGFAPVHPPARPRTQVLMSQSVGLFGEGARQRMAGPHQHPVVLAGLAVAHRLGLVARQATQHRLEHIAQRRLRHQQDLGIDHATGHADGGAGRCHMRRDAAAQIKRRQRGAPQPLLQQDEARVIAHQSARLVALEHQAVEPGDQWLVQRFGVGHLRQQTDTGLSQRRTHRGVRAEPGAIDDDPGQTLRHPRQQTCRTSGVQFDQAHAESRTSVARHLIQRQIDGYVVQRAVFRIENTDRTGTCRPYCQRRIDVASGVIDEQGVGLVDHAAAQL
jgi:hypothetical protein